MRNKRPWRWVGLISGLLVFALLVFLASSPSFLSRALYPNAGLKSLVFQHVELVAVSSLLAIFVSVPLGIYVTRPSGRDFQPLVDQAASFGQTFPPVAVLALAVPALGFGFMPTIVALWLYGLLPVIRNSIAGLNGIAPEVLNSARGMGMSQVQTLIRIEMPLAAPAILAGIRTSVVINIGTAMIGALIGAGGLGVPVVAGLVQSNIGYVLEGAIPAATLALLADQSIAAIEDLFSYRSP